MQHYGFSSSKAQGEVLCAFDINSLANKGRLIGDGGSLHGFPKTQKKKCISRFACCLLWWYSCFQVDSNCPSRFPSLVYKFNHKNTKVQQRNIGECGNDCPARVMIYQFLLFCLHKPDYFLQIS